LLCAAPACSSPMGGTSGGGGSSDPSASSASTGAGTSTTAGPATAGSGATTTTGTTSATGAGGGPSCPACSIVIQLPPGGVPYGLFVDAENVYWTDRGSGQVMQAALDGSNPIVLAAGEDSPIALQVVGGHVYWVSYSAVGVLRRVPIGGGPVVDLVEAPAARKLVVGADFIWWTREPDDIQRVPIAGLPDGGVADLLSANLLTNGIALDASAIYWVNRADGYVKKADYDLGNETAIGTGDVPWDIAVDDARVYWTEQGSVPGSGRVAMAGKQDGSGAVVLADQQGKPHGIAIDAERVYWANEGDGTIAAAPIAGGPAVVLAEGQDAPANVAVSPGHVYWTNTAGGAIVRIAK
jgi:hypothetical protein